MLANDEFPSPPHYSHGANFTKCVRELKKTCTIDVYYEMMLTGFREAYHFLCEHQAEGKYVYKDYLTTDPFYHI